MSATDSDETAPNIRPTADAGIDQIRYIISVNDSLVDCMFPLDNTYDEYGNEILDDWGNPVLDNINNSAKQLYQWLSAPSSDLGKVRIPSGINK